MIFGFVQKTYFGEFTKVLKSGQHENLSNCCPNGGNALTKFGVDHSSKDLQTRRFILTFFRPVFEKKIKNSKEVFQKKNQKNFFFSFFFEKKEFF